MNNTIEEALKIAVVDAFFNQKTYYDGNGTQHSYGGQLCSVVEKALTLIDLDEIVKIIVDKINTDEEIKKDLAAQISNKIPDLFYSQNHWNNSHEKTKLTVQNAVSEILLNSEEFKTKVLERVKLEGKDIQISVNISDKKG